LEQATHNSRVAMAADARIIDLMTSSSIKKLHPKKHQLTALGCAARMSAMAGDLR
jgi:hypothetical protein